MKIMAKQSKRKRNGNEVACYKRYEAENRHYKNKVRKLTKYVKNNPSDEQAKSSLVKIVEAGIFVYTRDRKAKKPNETVQKRIKKSQGFSNTQNKFYRAIEPTVPSIVSKKA